MNFRNGQWVKFTDLQIGVDGVTQLVSEHCPEVQKASDGKLVGIFSVQSTDKQSGKKVPAQISPVAQGVGANLRLPNKATMEFELVTFIDHAAQAEMVAEENKSLCACSFPPFQSLSGLEPVTERADLPAQRVMDEGFTPEA